VTARRGFWAVAIYLLAALPVGGAQAFPLSGDQTVLPPGTELNEDALYRPTEVFHSEARGGFKRCTSCAPVTAKFGKAVFSFSRKIATSFNEFPFSDKLFLAFNKSGKSMSYFYCNILPAAKVLAY
jgi:hypothetical protein